MEFFFVSFRLTQQQEASKFLQTQPVLSPISSPASKTTSTAMDLTSTLKQNWPTTISNNSTPQWSMQKPVLPAVQQPALPTVQPPTLPPTQQSTLPSLQQPTMISSMQSSSMTNLPNNASHLAMESNSFNNIGRNMMSPNINPVQQNMSFNRFPNQWNQNNNPWSSNKPLANTAQNTGNWSALDSLLPTNQQSKQPMNQMMTQKQPLLPSNQNSEKTNMLSNDDIMDLLS